MERAIEECRANGEPLYVNVLVLCELVWVLSYSYGQPEASIVRILEWVLQTEQFRNCIPAPIRGPAASEPPHDR